MLYYLLEKGHATAPELAEKFEVSVRTIYRDVDVLSSAENENSQVKEKAWYLNAF